MNSSEEETIFIVRRWRVARGSIYEGRMIIILSLPPKASTFLYKL